jgi:hypothetical protein
MLLCALFALSSGCATAAQQRSEPISESLRRQCGLPSADSKVRMTAAATLFEAIVSVAGERGWKVDACSIERGLLTTTFSGIGEDLRRRRVVRVLKAGNNVALRVQHVVQRRSVEGSQVFWFEVEEQEILRAQSRQEREIARAIERRFHRLR